MIKKVVHLADIHVRLFKRLDEYELVFQEFYNQLEEIKPDRIVIVGDLAHNKIQASPELFATLCKFLNKCTQYCEKLIIVPGNHDTILGSDRLDVITPIIEALNNPKIIYSTKSEVITDEDINWCHWSIFEEYKTPEIKKEKGKINVGLYHGVIQGSQNAFGYDFDNHGMPIGEFDNCDICMFGDIHLYQHWRNGELVMPSSMIQQNFGESPENHGFVLWERNNKNKFEHQIIELKNDYGYYSLELNGFDKLQEL